MIAARVALALAALSMGACREGAPGPAPSSSLASSADIASSAPVVSAATTSSTSPRDPDRPVAPARVADREEVFLGAASITSLTAVRGPVARRGSFDVELGSSEGPRRASLSIALGAAPLAHHRPLAFYRLSRALGARVVPATTRRSLVAGDLAALADADAMAILRGARVLNDGTVDALLSARAPSHAGSPWAAPEGRPLETERARELVTWERWALSEAPIAGEDRELLRDYVEMLVLDYLAANDARTSALLAGRALILADNASAFPPHPATSILDRMLRRLRAVQRFPSGIREALLGFDEARSAEAFAPGAFSTWILPPRMRVDVHERRATLLTLIEAKVAARGAEAVLCL